MPDGDPREALATIIRGGPFLSEGRNEDSVQARLDALLATLASLGYVRITGDREQVEQAARGMYEVPLDEETARPWPPEHPGDIANMLTMARAALTALREGTTNA